jgi:septal ring factor EnvC (AmiA/AmiB activator)
MKSKGVPVIALLLCAACASHDLPPKELVAADLEAFQEAVSVKVSDAQRAARLNQSINELGQQLQSFQAARDRFQADFLALNSRTDVMRAELEDRIEQFDSQRRAIRARVFELHSQLIAATTADEWKGLFPYERALLTDSGR